VNSRQQKGRQHWTGKAPARLEVGEVLDTATCGLAVGPDETPCPDTTPAPNTWRDIPCRVRLIEDREARELFTICQHNTMSWALKTEKLVNPETRSPRPGWERTPRPFATTMVWESITEAKRRHRVLADTGAAHDNPPPRGSPAATVQGVTQLMFAFGSAGTQA
jgi:hypothetical protein